MSLTKKRKLNTNSPFPKKARFKAIMKLLDGAAKMGIPSVQCAARYP
jgi:hypothetical protein